MCLCTLIHALLYQIVPHRDHVNGSVAAGFCGGICGAVVGRRFTAVCGTVRNRCVCRNCRCKVPTGIAVAPSRPDVALCIFPRSGLSTKHGITLINSVGLVDSDYRGELLIPLINHGSEPFTVEAGMRIAQLVVLPILTPELKEVTRLDTTERGAGGFGASGLS